MFKDFSSFHHVIKMIVTLISVVLPLAWSLLLFSFTWLLHQFGMTA